MIFQKAAVTLLQGCQIDILKSLKLPFDESFDSVELDGELRRMSIDSALQEEAVEIPPAKRRKLQSEMDVLGEITTQLYTLFGSQTAIDLDGLDQVAESVYYAML